MCFLHLLILCSTCIALENVRKYGSLRNKIPCFALCGLDPGAGSGELKGRKELSDKVAWYKKTAKRNTFNLLSF